MRQDRVIAGTLAKWSVVTLFFSLSSSRALFSLAGILVFIGLIFEGQWRTKWDILKTNKPALAIIAMVIWFYLSIFWTHANSKDLTNAAQTHWKLLLIPAIVVLIQDEHWKNRCWQGFAAGMVILLAHVYALSWGIDSLTWTSGIPDRVFFNSIPQAIGLAIFSAWCLKEFLHSENIFNKITYGAVFIAASYALFSLSRQRSGQIIWIINCFLIILLDSKSNQKKWKIFFIILSIIFIFSISEKIQDRFILVANEIINYNFENKLDYSSAGERFHMWYASLNGIAKAPFIGHGIGSYPHIAEIYFDDSYSCSYGCKHPHNQYLFYAVEFGIVGMIIFIWMLYQSFILNSTSKASSTMPLVILTTIGIISLIDSTLWYRGFLYLFIPLLAISMININAQHKK